MLYVEVDILKGLTFKTVGGINYNGNGDHTYAIQAKSNLLSESH